MKYGYKYTKLKGGDKMENLVDLYFFSEKFRFLVINVTIQSIFILYLYSYKLVI